MLATAGLFMLQNLWAPAREIIVSDRNQGRADQSEELCGSHGIPGHVTCNTRTCHMYSQDISHEFAGHVTCNPRTCGSEAETLLCTQGELLHSEFQDSS